MLQTFMRSFVVVVQPPQPSHLANVAQRLEEVSVQELVAERAVEALRKAVLHWLTLLNVDDLNAVSLKPVSEGARYQLRPIIYPYLIQQASLGLQLLHDSNQALGWR